MTTSQNAHASTSGQTGIHADGLTVQTVTGQPIVNDVSLRIGTGEIAGLVGESGSGKTTVAHAFVGYTRPGLQITGGAVWVDNQNIFTLPTRQLVRLRGSRITYVPQDPGTSLNPLMTVGAQLREVERKVGCRGGQSAVHDTLEMVGLSPSKEFLGRRAHQLSGGQQQRLLLAMAFAGHPSLVVLDEPTTALDVMTQHRVLMSLRQLTEHTSAAVLYVSHDLAVVNEIADSITVMYAGSVVERGPSDAVVSAPNHPYSRGLVAAVPRKDSSVLPRGISGRAPSAGDRQHGCDFAPRCEYAVTQCRAERPPLLAMEGQHRIELACHRRAQLDIADTLHPARTSDSGRSAASVTTTDSTTTATSRVFVDNLTVRYRNARPIFNELSVQFARHGCTAIVGESGSGKSSFARTLAGLQPAASGSLLVDDEVIDLTTSHRSRDLLRKIQYVFQNPAAALNPRKTIEQTLADSIRAFDTASRRCDVDRRISTVLDQVSLPSSARQKYPAQMSGGERQRVGIARALVVQPAIMVCDEVTSALDVSVQASVTRLLRELCTTGQITMLFVTHNMALVRSLADEVIVLQNGHVAELGTVDSVFDAPAHAYTRALIERTPSISLQHSGFGLKSR